MSHVWWDKHNVLTPRSSIISPEGMLVLTAPSEQPHKSSSCSWGARRSLVISGPERWRQIQYINQVQVGGLGNQRLLRTSHANNWRQGESCIDKKQAKIQILASQIPNQRKKHSTGVLMSLVLQAQAKCPRRPLRVTLTTWASGCGCDR